mgnify:CR=1 FL=1
MDVDSKAEMSFWDHLDALRGVLLRSAGLVLVLALLLFVLKDWFFDIEDRHKRHFPSIVYSG